MQNDTPPTDAVFEPGAFVDESVHKSAELRAFLKFVSERSGNVFTETQLKVFWPLLCQAALEWMVVERKSVDLGFLNLHPCPYRANWKAILLAVFERLGPALWLKSRVEKEAIIKAAGLHAFLMRGELMAVSQGKGILVWGVETEVKRAWYKAVFSYETLILRVKGPYDYCRYAARQINDRFRETMLRCYYRYLYQVSFPVGSVFKSRLGGGQTLRPRIPKGRVRPVGIRSVPTSRVVPRTPEDVSPNDSVSLVSEDEAVSEMLRVLEEPEELRPEGLDMDEPGDGPV